jgi:aminoglycoside phosphotransferase (APT) family kinase protein
VFPSIESESSMPLDIPSSTAQEINASLVRRLIAAQFPGWADLPVRPVEFDGWDNRTFRLGDGLAVRMPSAAMYVLQVEKEQRWLPRLAPLLPLPIPTPVAMGNPSEDYPWPWSIYRWIEGEIAATAPGVDRVRFARSLAQFLNALRRVDATGGPPPGPHNFYRGGRLSIYDGETRRALAGLAGKIDTVAAAAVWDAALKADWRGPAVWLHGDMSATNLLVKNGRLSSVIDFGSSGVGDPACDTTIAWTYLSGKSREVFRAALAQDDATWARGRGWALWKALIVYAGHCQTHPHEARKARQIIDAVLAEHRQND